MPQELKLPPSNVTIAGAFNAAILRPDWLRRNIFHDEVLIEVLFPIASGSFFYRRPDLDLVWWLSRETFVIAGPLERAAHFAVAVLEKLPETPLVAAGVNHQTTRVLLERNEWLAHLESTRERARRLLGGDGAGSASIFRTRREDGVTVTATLRDASLPMAVLDLNYHRDAEGTTDPEKSKMICRHIARVPEFEREAITVAREVFGDND